jgi:hypothetical protein
MSEHANRLPDEVAELLSALVDGEVSEAERADAEGWLARSAAAQEEYADLGRVKEILAGLPSVEPPAGFYEGLLQRRFRAGRSWASSPAALVASAVATAAAWLVLGGAGADRLVPPVDDVRGVAVAGGDTVTVVRQDGSVDWDELPAGVRSQMPGTDLWVAAGDGPATVVAERDGTVYTLASDELTPAGLVVLLEDLPEDDDSTMEAIVEKARNASETLVATFVWG